MDIIDISQTGLRDIMENMLVGAQRSRSISRENEDEELLNHLEPWLFGVNSILPRIADICMSNNQLEFLTVLNFCSIVHRHCLGVHVCAPYAVPSPEQLFAAQRR